MDWGDFSGKKVALLGAGMENVALIPYLLNSGAFITICEQWEKDIPETVISDVVRQTGLDHLTGLDQFDYIFRSPGLPISRIDAALAGATKQPIRTTAMDLFLSLGLCTTIGVTGTKGKGTTTTMIEAILKEAGRDVIVAGNIGKVIFDYLGQITRETIVVMEMSSFQLEDIRHSPSVAVLLPVGVDHLQPFGDRSPNFHRDEAAYAGAKANITAFQRPTDLLVFAADSVSASAIAASSPARTIAVGSKASASLTVSDSGEISVDGNIILNLAETGLRGEHIFLDAALAVAVTREFGATTEKITAALSNYQPLPHRLQTVGTFNGVTYIDDSYATAPEASIAAVRAFDRPIVWIGGGMSKGADFTELGQAISNSTVKAAILMGREAEHIRAVLPEALRVKTVDSMASAIAAAEKFAEKGDIVLLSPACASTDMFKNAADRGDQFQSGITHEY